MLPETMLDRPDPDPRGAMPILSEREWQLKYTPDDGNMVELFYVPALRCAKSYDRSTGYFSAAALALAMRGIEEVVRNGGHIRLIVGCTLDPPEIEAIERGEALKQVVGRQLAAAPLNPPDQGAHDALELLAWLVEKGILEVKLAVPCDAKRRPIPADGIFHEKAGIIQDGDGNRLAFVGSINETAGGWKHNWEKFHVFCSWTGKSDAARVAEEEADFAKIWANKSHRVITLDVPEAVRQDLLRFLPADDRPARLKPSDVPVPDEPQAQPEPVEDPVPVPDLRQQVWSFIQHAAAMSNGECVGEATCPVEPWPHQVRAFQRLYHADAPKLLIADEVGLGKTIQAGMLLRQAWLSGRAKRILILTPAAVMKQWQIELREKFGLNWPIYDDGKLWWYPSPAVRGREARSVSRDDWHNEAVVIASSHLMRRKDREAELCEQAEPWDLVILDEAHHARRKAAGSPTQGGPNALLRLMQRLKSRTRGLVLLTATPMQVHPIEIWDLLNLLGLPPEWDAQAFLRCFEILDKPSPSHVELDYVAELFQAIERHFGPVEPTALRPLGISSNLKAKKILGALRDRASIPRHQLETKDRQAALKLVRSNTPISRLVSRHTRELLRRYYKAGKISTPVATRKVEDRFIDLTPAERAVYDAVEDYIPRTYNQAAEDKRSAVGFVMTIYRRRLASSFYALRKTLEARLEAVDRLERLGQTSLDFSASEEDLPDDEAADEVLAAPEAAALEQKALVAEERGDLDNLLRQVCELPTDTKAERLKDVLSELRARGYPQVMVFTQYTDTMDFLRDELASEDGKGILCFSGRGGEVLATDGSWRAISRDEVKRRFREGQAELLLCTDAAAEGLNFQFCGALVNLDVPWNPMKVEQRIGRIDRLGSAFTEIRIVNLHYADTVEADVYKALRRRIGLFENVVGRLQPILSRLPKTISTSVLSGAARSEDARSAAVNALEREVDEAQRGGFDLDSATHDEELSDPVRPPAPLDLDGLDAVIRRPELMPPGIDVGTLGHREYRYLTPGQAAEIRVTTDAAYYEAHAESVELWTPGGVVFPVNPAAEVPTSDYDTLGRLLSSSVPA